MRYFTKKKIINDIFDALWIMRQRAIVSNLDTTVILKKYKNSNYYSKNYINNLVLIDCNIDLLLFKYESRYIILDHQTDAVLRQMKLLLI